MTVDFLLLSLTGAMLRRDLKLIRQILAAMLGGVSSFYIFLETKSILLDFLFRAISCFLISAVAFSFRKVLFTLKAAGVFIILSIGLSGLLEAVVSLFKINSVITENTFVYIGISPLVLILLSVVFYLIAKLLVRLFKNDSVAEECTVEVFLNDKTVQFFALVDSGNSVTDLLSDSEVFIASKKATGRLLGGDAKEYLTLCENRRRCRMIPTKTVNGDSLMYAVRCDKAKITEGSKSFIIQKPIIAESEFLDSPDYDIIIPKGVFKGR